MVAHQARALAPERGAAIHFFKVRLASPGVGRHIGSPVKGLRIYAAGAQGRGGRRVALASRRHVQFFELFEDEVVCDTWRAGLCATGEGSLQPECHSCASCCCCCSPL